MDSIAEIAAELEAIAERLLDLSLDRLREATASEPDERDRLMGEEKVLTRARRAVEKAATLLRGPDTDGDDGGSLDP